MRKKTVYITIAFVALITMTFFYNLNYSKRIIEDLTGEDSNISTIKTIRLSELEATIYSADINELSHILVKKSLIRSKLVDELKQGEVLKSLEKFGYTYAATNVASKNNEWLIYGKYNPKKVRIRVFLENKKNEQVVYYDETQGIWWSVLTSPMIKNIIIESQIDEGPFTEIKIEF